MEEVIIKLQAILVAALTGALLSSCTATPAPTATPADTTRTTSAASAGEVTQVTEYARWQDDRISESSGLALLDRTLLTVNDSGDPAVIYCSTDGTVSGTISYATADPADVEAITTDAEGGIWVGDVGDNAENRTSITLYHLAPGTALSGDVTTTADQINLQYPDGPHNAESLLVHPVTGEVLIATKSDTSTQVYSAGVDPSDGATLSLISTDQLLTTVSDGAFSPTGDQVWLRNDGTVAVYSYPGWTLLTEAALPAEPNGEGLTPGPDGTWLTDSEEVGTPIWQWTLTVD